MSNTFWAVFYGSTLGTFTVHVATGLLDEWRATKRRKDLELLFESIQDSDLEEYED